MNQVLPGLWEIDEIGDTVHCYAFEWEEGITLIDTGMPKNAATIMDAIKAQGWPLHLVRRIIITHMDVDHAGGLLKLKQATRAPVACHTVEKEFLEHPTRRRPGPLLLRPLHAAISALPQLRVNPVVPDELMVEGQVTPEGFTVVHTPGHTPGHISLLHKEKRFLIVGDALSNWKGKLALPPALFTPDMANAQRSVWKLAKKHGDEFDAAVFGHGVAIPQNAGKRVKAFASQIFSTEV